MTDRNRNPNAPGQRPHPGGRGRDPRQQHPDPRVQRAMAAQAASASGRRGGQTRRRAPKSGGGFSFLSLLFYVFFGLIALVGLGVAYLMFAPPTELIRKQMISQVKAQTGRDLSIGGKPQLTFYPAIGLSMRDIKLSAPPGMSAPNTLTADSLTVAVKLLPLISRNIEVDSLILNKPVIDLRSDAQGRKSWEFSQAARRANTRYAQAERYAQAGTGNDANGGLPPEAREFLQNATPTGGRAGSSAASLDGLKLGDVRIVNGTLRYADEATGASEVVRRLNVNLALDEISAPLKADGNAEYKGEAIAFEGTVRSLKQILENAPAKVAITIAGKPIAAGFDGTVTLGDAVKATGAVSADSPSVRRLAAWLGSQLPAARGFGPLTLKGQLSANGPTYQLSRMTATLDGATATGNVAVQTDRARPMVTADLNLSKLDLNLYVPVEGGPTAVGGDAGGATRVKGYTQRSGWATDPIDLTGLKAVDANLNLAVGPLLFRDLRAEQSLIKATLTNGAMTANLSEMKLYQGTGRGILKLTSLSPAATDVGANFTFDNVSAQPLLRDAVKFDRLAGKGKLGLALATRGGNQAQFVSGLNGKVTFNFFDGAIAGVNIAKYLRAISTGQFADLMAAPTEKTDFSEMSASFNVANGVASNSDLKLLSPLLRVGGSGTISLPPQQIDYTLRPKLVSSLSGQGGNAAADGIEVPVRITGDLSNPKYTPDLQSILNDPNKAIDTVKGITDKFKGKNAGEIIDGLLGGGGEGEKTDAKQLLKGLFGR
ncbi:MAG: AsmA family protein [Pseudomonadota bacterium]